VVVDLLRAQGSLTLRAEPVLLALDGLQQGELLANVAPTGCGYQCHDNLPSLEV
jgi:hypothetical protein